jgi:hypothetical protein
MRWATVDGVLMKARAISSRFGRQGGMTAGEDQPQPIVFDALIIHFGRDDRLLVIKSFGELLQ